MAMPPSGRWHAMRRDDIAAITAISDAVHGGRYTEPGAVYAERLDRFPAGCFVFERDGRIVGYLLSHPWHRDRPPALGQPIGAIPEAADSYYLHDIALLPDAQGCGAGRQAVALVVGLAKAGGFGDVTLTAVDGADPVWRSLGFDYVEAAEAAGPGSYGAEARLMRLAVD